MTDATVVDAPVHAIDAERFLDTLGKTDELPSTDDVLARILPLFEQVAAVHDAGRVAPLEGVEQVRAVGGRLFFADDGARTPRRDARVEHVAHETGAVRVAGRFRRDDATGSTDQIGRASCRERV